MNKDTQIILGVLIRQEFDRLSDDQFREAAPKLIAAAAEIGLGKLASEMRNDFNFTIKATTA